MRHHTTKSLIDYTQNKSPGELVSLDTGDSNVYSVFRNSRYTVNFICVVSFYRATVYLQENSTRFSSRHWNALFASFSTSAAARCAKLCLICFRLTWSLDLSVIFETRARLEEDARQQHQWQWQWQQQQWQQQQWQQ